MVPSRNKRTKSIITNNQPKIILKILFIIIFFNHKKNIHPLSPYSSTPSSPQPSYLRKLEQEGMIGIMIIRWYMIWSYCHHDHDHDDHSLIIRSSDIGIIANCFSQQQQPHNCKCFHKIANKNKKNWQMINNFGNFADLKYI